MQTPEVLRRRHRWRRKRVLALCLARRKQAVRRATFMKTYLFRSLAPPEGLVDGCLARWCFQGRSNGLFIRKTSPGINGDAKYWCWFLLRLLQPLLLCTATVNPLQPHGLLRRGRVDTNLSTQSRACRRRASLQYIRPPLILLPFALPLFHLLRFPLPLLLSLPLQIQLVLRFPPEAERPSKPEQPALTRRGRRTSTRTRSPWPRSSR